MQEGPNSFNWASLALTFQTRSRCHLSNNMVSPAQDVHDDSDEEKSKKRKRNETEWKRNKTKKARAEGQEYVNTRGKVQPKRKTGTQCR